MRTKEVIKKCVGKFTHFSSFTDAKNYKSAKHAESHGLLVRSEDGFVATEKGIKYLEERAQRSNNPKLRIVLSEASSEQGYIATEDFSSTVRYAKKCGFIEVKPPHKRKYYAITEKGRKKLASLEAN